MEKIFAENATYNNINNNSILYPLIHFNIFKNLYISEDLKLNNLNKLLLLNDNLYTNNNLFIAYKKITIPIGKINFYYVKNINNLMNLIIFVSDKDKILPNFYYGVEINKKLKNKNINNILNSTSEDCCYYVLNDKKFPLFLLNNNTSLITIDKYKSAIKSYDINIVLETNGGNIHNDNENYNKLSKHDYTFEFSDKTYNENMIININTNKSLKLSKTINYESKLFINTYNYYRNNENENLNKFYTIIQNINERNNLCSSILTDIFK